MPRDHPTPAPDSPARRRAAEVKMVEYITTAHGIAQRLSEKWRHFALYICCLTFGPSLFLCWRDFVTSLHFEVTNENAYTSITAIFTRTIYPISMFQSLNRNIYARSPLSLSVLKPGRARSARPQRSAGDQAFQENKTGVRH